MGRRGQENRNCRRIVQQLCREEEVGFVDLWGYCGGKADINSGMDSIITIFGR